jgi:hypothetical protein
MFAGNASSANDIISFVESRKAEQVHLHQLQLQV